MTSWAITSCILVGVILPLSAEVRQLHVNWWDQGPVVDRLARWQDVASSNPDEAARLLAELAETPDADPRRMEAVMRHLARKPRFPQLLGAVVTSDVCTAAVDRCLVAGRNDVVEVVSGMLGNRVRTSIAVRIRLARVLEKIETPESALVIIGILLGEDDATVHEAAAGALAGLSECMPIKDRLLELVNSQHVSRESRIRLIMAMGRFPDVDVIDLLIRECLHKTDPFEREAASAAIEEAAAILRRTDPRSTPAEVLLLGADRLWDGGQNATNLLGATAATVWARLKPIAFEGHLLVCHRNAGFWLETSADPVALSAWTHAVNHAYAWPSPIRLAVIETLLVAAHSENCTSAKRNAIVTALTRAFDEWPVITAIAAIKSKEPTLLNAGRHLLIALGRDLTTSVNENLEHHDAIVAIRAFVGTTDDDIILAAAIHKAGRAAPALRWAARELIDCEQHTAHLRSYILAYADDVRDPIVRRLLDRADDVDLNEITRVCEVASQRAALAILASRGDLGAAMDLAHTAPDTFCEQLTATLRCGSVDRAGLAASVLAMLVEPSNPGAGFDQLQRLYSKAGPDDRGRHAGWDNVAKWARNHRAMIVWSLRSILNQPDSARSKAVAAALTPCQQPELRRIVEEYRQRNEILESSIIFSGK